MLKPDRPLAYYAGLLITALAGCHKGTPQRDSDTPSVVLERSSRYVRSQTLCTTQFKARLTGPSPIRPISSEGTALWVSPKTVYVRYHTSGQERKLVVRADEKNAWVYFNLGLLWATADEIDMRGAGTGVFSIADSLAAMSRRAGAATLAASGAVRVRITGTDLQALLAGYPDDLAYSIPGVGSHHYFSLESAEAEVELTTDADGRPRKLTCKASLQTLGPIPEGPYQFDLEAEFVDSDPASGWEFFSREGATPPSPEMKTAVESAAKTRRP